MRLPFEKWSAARAPRRLAVALSVAGAAFLAASLLAPDASAQAAREPAPAQQVPTPRAGDPRAPIPRAADPHAPPSRAVDRGGHGAAPGAGSATGEVATTGASD